MANQIVYKYLNLSPPQVIDNKWRDLSFDLAQGQNVVQDIHMPESGGGYVYRESSTLGSSTQNRLLYWRTANDIFEIVELSSEAELEDNQIRIRFADSPVVNDINIIEFSESIVIMIATVNSVHRFDLPHPRATNKSVLHQLNSNLLFDPANYYILSNHGSIHDQQPICATSWYDRNFLKCALSFPDSSIVIVQFAKNSHQITLCEIKQVGIIGRLWSRIPNLLNRTSNECVNSIYTCAAYHNIQTRDVLLFALCRDWKVRIFSYNSRECVHTQSIIAQSSFSQSMSLYAGPTIEKPMMKLSGSRIVIYLPEDRPEFAIYSYETRGDAHILEREGSVPTPSWENLIDFSVSNQRIWALANFQETESALYYLDLNEFLDKLAQSDDEIEANWEEVNFIDGLDTLPFKNYISEIFWKNNFSIATVAKAFNLCMGQSAEPPKEPILRMDKLLEAAYTGIVDSDQDEAWKKFYNYCLQSHYAANKDIGLAIAADESIISVIKRSNPSFVCPWLMNQDSDGPYRGIKTNGSMQNLLNSLNYIYTDLINDDLAEQLETCALEKPTEVLKQVGEVASNLIKSNNLTLVSLNVGRKNLLQSIENICLQLDMAQEAEDFLSKVLKSNHNTSRSRLNPLASNTGIILTFEMFKALTRARMNLSRDLLVYLHIISILSETDKVSTIGAFLKELCYDVFTSGKIRCLADSLRSYATLVWVSETPVIEQNSEPVQNEVIDHIARHFNFFKSYSYAHNASKNSSLEMAIYQNLLMSFLINGGGSYNFCIESSSELPHTVSNSFYVTEVAKNLCKLLWPTTKYMALPEYMFTRKLDGHLGKYLDLTEEWTSATNYDRIFIRAANGVIQNRAIEAVDVFNTLWMHITRENLIGRFIGLSDENHQRNADNSISINPSLIHRYYDKLVELFNLTNNHIGLINLINYCMSLLDGNADDEQKHWVNCYRAKLFQYHLELEDSDEAYHTMVLTTDPVLRTNCLRKFIIHHCEKEQWSNLLSYPYIDIKQDFIDILTQKAESADLSNLSDNDSQKTSYYDLLFASYVSDDEFKLAAEVMHNYAQRLALEVPGIKSIRKQADCLITALNALRCVDEKKAFIDNGINVKEEGRRSVLKRAHDCEHHYTSNSPLDAPEKIPMPSAKQICCKDLKMKYELTSARLKLLEKDKTAYAIALSPLKPEETIAQLVAASMFSTAMDLAILFKSSMDLIFEELTAKFVFTMKLSSVDASANQELDRNVSEFFTESYSNIDTYNYIANSTVHIVDKLWRFIDYYLTTYDGISHRYSNNKFKDTFSGTTVLVRVVAFKLLSSGRDIPASLKRLYTQKNPSELLKLLIKFDCLEPAAELANEMMDRILEPSLSFTQPFQSSEPPPVYLPTHLIQLLITYLNEDATNIKLVKIGDGLIKKLNKFRNFV